MGREGEEDMYGQTGFFGEWEKVLDSSLVFRSVPRLFLWVRVLPSFNQFKNLRLLSILCYYTALFVFFGEASELLFFFLLLTLTTILLLRLVLFLLLFFLGCHLFVSLSLCLSRLLFNLAERKMDGKIHSTSDYGNGYGMERKELWLIRIYSSCACKREQFCIWDMWLVCNCGCRFCLDFTLLYSRLVSSHST
jgi:hypothetical protein